MGWMNKKSQFDSQQRNRHFSDIFLLQSVQNMLGPNQPPIQWVPEALSLV
jgi:hypothetical protein